MDTLDEDPVVGHFEAKPSESFYGKQRSIKPKLHTAIKKSTFFADKVPSYGPKVSHVAVPSPILVDSLRELKDLQESTDESSFNIKPKPVVEKPPSPVVESTVSLEPPEIFGPHLPSSSPTAASTASPAAAAVTEPVIEKSTISPVPLPNLGNTCYMNSVIQSIFSLKSFMDLLSKTCKLCHDESNQPNGDTLDGSHGEASEKVLQLSSQLVSLWSAYESERQRDAFQLREIDINDVLSTFKSAVGNYNDQFHSGCQQDAVEFVELILDTMTDEFKTLLKNLNPGPINCINPVQLFKIELKSRSTCTSCGHVTRLPNIISNTLYLNIPSDHEEGTLTLQDVVDLYFNSNGKTEQNCDQGGCKGNEKLLTTSVGSLPKFLAVQLGRYTMVGEKIHTKLALHPNIWLPNPRENENTYINSTTVIGQTIIEPAIISNNRPMVPTLGGSSPMKKPPNSNGTVISAQIGTPMCSLSLDSPPATPPALNSPNNSLSPISACVSPIASTSPILRTEGVEYNLKAIICHRGSTRDMGHYYTFVRNTIDDKWYSCDDDTIKCLPFDEVATASRSRCYCFFFEQNA